MSADCMILAENCIYDTDAEKTQLNNNVIVCGSSGSGKTFSVTEPCLLETYNSSLIVTLSKRRLVKKYSKLFLERGYKVLDLNFINPDSGNVSYDPIAYVKSYRDIIFLAESIVKANPRKQNSTADPYWDECAVSLLAAEIAYIIVSKKFPSFTDVLTLNDSLEMDDADGGAMITSLDEKFNSIRAKNPNHFALSCWRSFSKLPSRTMRCVFGALNTTLDTIFTPELRRAMKSKNSIDFSKFTDEKTVLFISTSAVNPSLNLFINTFFAQAFKQLFEIAEKKSDAALKIPVRVICDDFAVGSKILEFPNYISILREKKISVTLLIQSDSQLESMYGYDDATTIRNNCDSYVYMGGMDLKTCENISRRLNVPLEDILYMPIGQAIVFRRGQKPIITQRYNIFGNELYQQLNCTAER